MTRSPYLDPVLIGEWSNPILTAMKGEGRSKELSYTSYILGASMAEMALAMGVGYHAG